MLSAPALNVLHHWCFHFYTFTVIHTVYIYLLVICNTCCSMYHLAWNDNIFGKLFYLLIQLCCMRKYMIMLFTYNFIKRLRILFLVSNRHQSIANQSIAWLTSGTPFIKILATPLPFEGRAQENNKNINFTMLLYLSYSIEEEPTLDWYQCKLFSYLFFFFYTCSSWPRIDLVVDRSFLANEGCQG